MLRHNLLTPNQCIWNFDRKRSLSTRKKWCVRQDLNLQPSDPKLIFRAYQRVSPGITNMHRTIEFIGQITVSGSAPEACQKRPGAAQIAAQPGQLSRFNSQC
jgi:hypothetical protein